MSWAGKLSKPYRIEQGKKFRLKDHDPTDTAQLSLRTAPRNCWPKVCPEWRSCRTSSTPTTAGGCC